MLVVEPDSDRVFAGLLHGVAHVARAVLAVLEVDHGLAGALDGDSQATMPSLSGPNVEVRGLTLDSALKAGTAGVNPVGATVLEWTNLWVEMNRLVL